MRQSRGTTKRKDGRGFLQVREFPSDSERYEWEVSQRFTAMDNLDRWVAADGIHTIGPPIPPGSRVFWHKEPTPAFKLATASGYVACRPAAEVLGLCRKSVRLLIDRPIGLDVAYVVYTGKIRNSRYHCRVIHRRSLRIVKKNTKQWLAKARKSGKKTTAANVRRGC